VDNKIRYTTKIDTIYKPNSTTIERFNRHFYKYENNVEGSHDLIEIYQKEVVTPLTSFDTIGCKEFTIYVNHYRDGSVNTDISNLTNFENEDKFEKFISECKIVTSNPTKLLVYYYNNLSIQLAGDELFIGGIIVPKSEIDSIDKCYQKFKKIN
jgi:hypothetical protein